MRNLILTFLLLFSCSLFAQKIICDNSNYADAFKLAINTVDINIRRGILAAGGDYGGEWTRDIAINTWNGVSLLRPEVAKQSLWSVTIRKDSIGHQYWDHIIWTVAALNHYKVTGDREFLRQAYQCSVNTLKQLEEYAFDRQYGLFTGPSVFNDGIAGYPEPIYDKSNNSSFVLDHKNSKSIKCLSTNCIYYGAYLSLIEMGQILKADQAAIQAYQQKAEALKGNILKYFYSEKENKLNYLIDNTGNVDKSQEGLGLSFAVIFHIINQDQAYKLIQNAATSKYGITSIYPDFPRYSQSKPGRHNNLIWPMVNGFFARASIISGNRDVFLKELNGLTQLALDQDKGNYNFREIYNPNTGAPDGGWQNGIHWNSCKLQTWSATAYINMILFGLAGMRFENDRIVFAPYMPESTHYLELSDIHYRQMILKIIVQGHGTKIKSFSLNGKSQKNHSLDSKIKGTNEIKIELE
ncbi:MAG: hypothetical protein Q8908_10230 [Bacteroidota bacterium]|nr:hypothetical protein [Bacteroidota bacterium]